MRYLIIGMVGFIALNRAHRLLTDGHQIYYEAGSVEGDSLSPVPPFRLGFIAKLEHAFGRAAQRTSLLTQDGDVPRTTPPTELLEHPTDYNPKTPITMGVPAFVRWYRHRHQA